MTNADKIQKKNNLWLYLRSNKEELRYAQELKREEYFENQTMVNTTVPPNVTTTVDPDAPTVDEIDRKLYIIIYSGRSKCKCYISFKQLR